MGPKGIVICEPIHIKETNMAIKESSAGLIVISVLLQLSFFQPFHKLYQKENINIEKNKLRKTKNF